jgi:hypothetical protein
LNYKKQWNPTAKQFKEKKTGTEAKALGAGRQATAAAPPP